MSNRHQQDELTPVENALKALQPSPVNVNRDRLLFRAGQASMRGRLWLYPTASALLALFVGIAGTSFTMRQAIRPDVRIQYVYVQEDAQKLPKEELPGEIDASQKTEPHESPPQKPPEGTDVVTWPDPMPMYLSGYLGMRNRVIRWGADALPSPPMNASGTEGPPPTLLRLWEAFAAADTAAPEEQ